jgi:hypothetical protein
MVIILASSARGMQRSQRRNEFFQPVVSSIGEVVSVWIDVPATSRTNVA